MPVRWIPHNQESERKLRLSAAALSAIQRLIRNGIDRIDLRSRRTLAGPWAIQVMLFAPNRAKCGFDAFNRCAIRIHEGEFRCGLFSKASHRYDGGELAAAHAAQRPHNTARVGQVLHERRTFARDMSPWHVALAHECPDRVSALVVLDSVLTGELLEKVERQSLDVGADLERY